MSIGQYTRHREIQRETLLNVAEDLFIKKGIELVTISDIAKAAKMTRPTLYKYFSCKEEIAVEIFKIITTEWTVDDNEHVWNKGGSGYDHIERFIMHHLERLFNNIREASFIAEFNYLYAKRWTGKQALEIIRETLGAAETNLRRYIKAGFSDGSIRTDTDVELLIAAIFNLNSGMMNRIGELGPKLDVEFGISSREIFSEIARLFLSGLSGGRAQKEGDN